MPAEQRTDHAEDSLFDLYKISVQDSFGRADLWMEIARALVRLGVLAESLRPPCELHRHIHAAASLCRTKADKELRRSGYFVDAMKSDTDALEHKANGNGSLHRVNEEAAGAGR